MTSQLFVLSAYSLLQSTNRLPDLVHQAKLRGYSSLALTDQHVMHGVIEFYQECLKQDIKPIIGLTITYQSERFDDRVFSLNLYAKNLAGYHNLLKISSYQMEQKMSAHLRLTDITDWLSDIVICTPWENSEFVALFQEKEYDLLPVVYREYLQLFQTRDWYHGLAYYQAEQTWREQFLQKISKISFPIVAMKKVAYLDAKDVFAVKVLHAIEAGTQVSYDDGVQSVGNNYLMKEEDFSNQYQLNQATDALSNLERIVNQCNVKIPLHQTLLPAFPVPKDTTAANYLKELCFSGLARIGQQDNSAYLQRLEYELDVIHTMGYDDYFLIVWDVMAYAREHEIVTACRGSAAGSLVSYVLQITNVDPIAYQLLFERFLNQERYTMPDIDMDIPDNRREEILNYVYDKYGYHRVAQIATFGTLAAKMALRDVARVFGLSQSEASKWANAIPSVLKITLAEALKTSKKLQQLVEFSDKNQLMFQVACQIEGLPRHVSTHAAGVVISDRELTDFVPLLAGSNNIPLTQFAMGEVETIGLLKMDFLGLRNLAIIGNTLDAIEYVTGERLSLANIPVDDEPTLKLFRKGETVGVFQFESSGIKNVLKKLGPTSIEDIASVNALYRPGPMQFIDQFIARKNGQQAVQYPAKSLEHILSKTYGIIVYQEQIMQIASKMAGFSLGQADILRRAISKKKKAVLDEERQHFVSGALKEGYPADVANEVYDYIERFANYGFNRSHAVVYSVLAYQMAYLKTHYSTYFFSALLHSVRNNPDKIKEYLAEAHKFDVTILPPNINQSEYSFRLVKGKLVFGLSSIKGVRKDFIQHIIEVRKQDGAFSSLENFLIRISGKWLKAENILPLIYVGAFDHLHSNRKQLVTDLHGLIRNIDYSGGSMDLLGVLSLKTDKVSDFSLNDKLQHEVTYLGTYVSGHPVEEYADLAKVYSVSTISDCVVNENITLLVYILSVKKIRTKKGESMVFLKVTDQSSDLEVTIFPKLFRSLGLEIEANQVVLLSGKVELSQYTKEKQLIASRLEIAENKRQQLRSKKCYIKIAGLNDSTETLNELKKVFVQFSGRIPVVLIFKDRQQNILLEENYWIKDEPNFNKKVEDILGSETIIIK
ncbi:DNA polymerase III subunit alpha [Vagococcus penaei]|uniref:DNA polymerase III subunit alpha n=1 Tax=Vagococcus penaei TaxID=633807 RepID=A0A1Q2D348_9ENTE|nr:DNA polymerase III subunit alpha [Vagococcus penaei]AQP52779.1 DNA polymerase III subunit alpha [Vagococcus penaei]RST98467.1 DNA polymerase III subunit alpha [Vagococcus penaei]